MERPDDTARAERDEERAVYIISVAAELAGVHPQTLRIYERKGLVAPKRTAGNTRRYSDRDIRLLRQIQDLTQESGINLAGVKMIIEPWVHIPILASLAVVLGVLLISIVASLIWPRAHQASEGTTGSLFGRLPPTN